MSTVGNDSETCVVGQDACPWAKNRLKWGYSCKWGRKWARVSENGRRSSSTRVVSSRYIKTREETIKKRVMEVENECKW